MIRPNLFQFRKYPGCNEINQQISFYYQSQETQPTLRPKVLAVPYGIDYFQHLNYIYNSIDFNFYEIVVFISQTEYPTMTQTPFKHWQSPKNPYQFYQFQQHDLIPTCSEQFCCSVDKIEFQTIFLPNTLNCEKTKVYCIYLGKEENDQFMKLFQDDNCLFVFVTLQMQLGVNFNNTPKLNSNFDLYFTQYVNDLCKNLLSISDLQEFAKNNKVIDLKIYKIMTKLAITQNIVYFVKIHKVLPNIKYTGLNDYEYGDAIVGDSEIDVNQIIM